MSGSSSSRWLRPCCWPGGTARPSAGSWRASSSWSSPATSPSCVTQTDAFGLDTDLARAVRLLFQPVLVVWALWSTGAWRAWRARRARLAGVELAVVGGGSTYTPELVDGLGRLAGELTIDELVLLDPDAERLAVVGAFADRILRHAGSATRLVTTSDRDEAIDGASAVLLQFRVGWPAGASSGRVVPPRAAAAWGRRRPVRAAWPRRCAPSRWPSISPERCPGGRRPTPGSWTSPIPWGSSPGPC